MASGFTKVSWSERYNVKPTTHLGPGEFKAWVTASRSGKRSGCAFEIRNLDNSIAQEAKAFPSGGVSELSRGYVSGGIGVLYALAPGSKVTIFCTDNHLVNGIERTFHITTNRELWKEFRLAERGLEVSADAHSDDPDLDAKIIRELKKKLKEVLAKAGSKK